MRRLDAAELRACLLKHNAISAPSLERAAVLSAAEEVRLDRALLRLGLLDEGSLLRAIAEVMDIELIGSSAGYRQDRDASDVLGRPYMTRHVLVPVESHDPSICMVMTADPAAIDTLREVAFFVEKPVTPIAAPTRVVAKMLEPDGEAVAAVSDERASKDRVAWRDASVDGPVIRFVARSLEEAIELGASDVHFANGQSGLHVRHRVNGLLVPYRVSDPVSSVAVMARLKVLAGMNVAETRLPQDGRLTDVFRGRVIDFRVSALPTTQGESIVCRVLDPKALRLGWDRLGFNKQTELSLKCILQQPSGLFLVTGPTGSGKTTTLYTALHHLHEPRRKIVTVEDPVEYEIDGIEQVQVQEAVGLTFARCLRAILRQDPNVLMIGEIRDPETAEIACRAALVGRLVMSTLHTSSPHAAGTRLIDLGVEPYIVKEVLLGVLGQDLEIVYCQSCEGAGCERCGQMGSVGRCLRAELVIPERAELPQRQT